MWRVFRRRKIEFAYTSTCGWFAMSGLVIRNSSAFCTMCVYIELLQFLEVELYYDNDESVVEDLIFILFCHSCENFILLLHKRNENKNGLRVPWTILGSLPLPKPPESLRGAAASNILRAPTATCQVTHTAARPPSRNARRYRRIPRRCRRRLGGDKVRGPRFRRPPIHVSETELVPGHGASRLAPRCILGSCTPRPVESLTCSLATQPRDAVRQEHAARLQDRRRARGPPRHRCTQRPLPLPGPLLPVSSSPHTAELTDGYLTMPCFRAAGDGRVEKEGGVPLLPRASLYVLLLFLRHRRAQRAALRKCP
jgi:hypothetical protein